MRTICQSYPDILQANSAALRVKTKRAEPQFFGQPQRIWRGRILRYLHTQTKPVALPSVGQALQPDWSADRVPWLNTVIGGLAKDGLVKYKNSHVKI